MMTPAEMDIYARELQRDYRTEAAHEAQARRLAPSPFDRFLAALRSRPANPVRTVPARPLVSPAAPR